MSDDSGKYVEIWMVIGDDKELVGTVKSELSIEWDGGSDE